MPEMQSVTLRAQHLSSALDFWNNMMLWGLVLAAIAALWIVVSTRLTVMRSKELSLVQGKIDELNQSQIAQLGHETERLRTGNIQLGIDLQIAKTESDKRQTELEVEQRKTAEAQKETAEAQKAADEARLALEKQVRLQGPRSRFLQESRSNLIERLRPYKGQSVIVIVCGADTLVDGEKTAFTNTLFGILFGSPDSAGWSPNLKYDDRCSGGPSVAVFVHEKAPQNTREAADVLAQQLNTIVPMAPKIALSEDPNSSGALALKAMGQESEKSVTRVLRDNPDAVVMFVGPHP